MAFSLPNFNLFAGIWHGLCPGGVPNPAPPALGPDATVPCQLYLWSKSIVEVGVVPPPGTSPLSYSIAVTLRVPAFTDIRDLYSAAGNDLVECPVGSNRFYYVNQVDDQHKGFPNEYRFALLQKVYTWPTPIP